MKKFDEYCYFDGKIVKINQATVSPTDIGLLRGFAIYDGITTFNQKPFRLKDHL